MSANAICFTSRCANMRSAPWTRPWASARSNFHVGSHAMPLCGNGGKLRLRAFTEVTGVLIQERPVSSAPSPPPQGSIDVKIEIATHRDMSKEKGFKPRLTLQFVSEDPNLKIPESQIFDATNWDFVQVPRQSGAAEGFGDVGTVFYATVQLPANFGTPGALLMTKQENPPSPGNWLTGLLRGAGQAPGDALLDLITKFVDPDSNHRIYIGTVKVGETMFHCHSAVHELQGERIFFSSDAKLPQDTPGPIASLRQKELYAIQGKDEKGKLTEASRQQRRSPDRIYDYQAYNDLGNPDKSRDLERPILGGAELPFPRRLRTGRPLTAGLAAVLGKREKVFEVAPPKQLLGLPIGLPWLPLDEQFNETKTFGFVGDELRAGISQIPSKIGSLFCNQGNKETYKSLHAVDALFTEPDDTDDKNGIIKLREADKVFDQLDDFWQASKFKLPRVRRNRQLVWCSDEEFGRQYLAGQHPCFIQAVTPEWLEGTLFTEDSIGGLLEGKTLTERLEEGGRLFRADYTAGFADYIELINDQKRPEGDTDIPWLTKDRVQHAGKALFYYTDNKYLVPVAIELQKKLNQEGTVYTPYDVKELWQLAKEIISSLDCGYHQLVSHYLRAHACQEPFIIATMRHLSALHPVYKLMLPHFRYTMHINANARSILVNADGTLEQTFTSGRFTMHLASYVYENLYRFDEQNFESDLIVRGMVQTDKAGIPVRDSAERLVPALDYPYAQDGLDIWYAMRDWFGAYLQLYYASDAQLKEDKEIQSWWTEVQAEGHPDKTVGWPALDTVTDLRDILTTIAFTGSAHHAAVNFGQYDYSGYMPNRPALIRKPIPERGAPGVKELKESYESELLSYLPNPEDSLAAALLYVVLSSHAPNEEYLDHKIPQWIDDEKARAAHKNFLTALAKLDEDISARNRSGSKIRGVVGTRGLAYELLRPNSKAGVTSRGVPCSTSI